MTDQYNDHFHGSSGVNSEHFGYFKKSHGYVNSEDYNALSTCAVVLNRKKCLIRAILMQVTPVLLALLHQLPLLRD